MQQAASRLASNVAYRVQSRRSITRREPLARRQTPHVAVAEWHCVPQSSYGSMTLALPTVACWRGASSARSGLDCPGAGLTYSRTLATTPENSWHEAPQPWHGGPEGFDFEYTAEDVAAWRADFRFPRRQHSLAQFGYTDDELLEWRKPFDALARGANRISFSAFKGFVAQKYKNVIPDDQITDKVQIFWNKFDRDKSDFIDFGEFIDAGLMFDIDWAKEKIRQDGIEETFAKYSEDDFMIEPHFFQLMCDCRFFVATASDVRKLVQACDQDSDGLVSLLDFVQWVESPDFSDPIERVKQRPLGGKVRLPPPEPED